MNSVAIVVPVRKMAGKLQNLESWLATCDTYSQITIYLVHDWGDHETWSDLKNVARRLNNKNVVLSECHAGNPGGARNFGLQQIKEEYIAFWDSDDIGYVENLIEVLNSAKDSEVLICNFETLQYGGQESRQQVHQDDFARIAKSPGIWRFLFKREFLDNRHFEDLAMGEDQLFLEQLDIPSSKYKFFDISIYCYVVHRPGSLTSTKNVKDLRKVIEKGIEILRYQNGKSSSFTRDLIRRQCLTLIRHGSKDLKYFGIFKLLKVFSFKIKEL